MTRITGPTTLTGTGIKTISVGFQPTWATFKVCSKVSSQNFSHLSIGETDGTAQWVESTFQDTTGGQSVNSTSKVISHYERVGGVLTEVLSASFDSFTATAVKLNVSVGNGNYQVMMTCGD